jgi:phosphoglycolate phosphatase-like HAD superfamily hydrolase
VGDTESDRAAACAAGAHFVAVGGQVKAPLHIRALAELPSLLIATWGENKT